MQEELDEVDDILNEGTLEDDLAGMDEEMAGLDNMPEDEALGDLEGDLMMDDDFGLEDDFDYSGDPAMEDPFGDEELDMNLDEFEDLDF